MFVGRLYFGGLKLTTFDYSDCFWFGTSGTNGNITMFGEHLKCGAAMMQLGSIFLMLILILALGALIAISIDQSFFLKQILTIEYVIWMQY